MIADLCKPLNPGENKTIRIIMVTPEAQRLLEEWKRLKHGGSGEATPELDEFFLMLWRRWSEDL